MGHPITAPAIMLLMMAVVTKVLLITVAIGTAAPQAAGTMAPIAVVIARGAALLHVAETYTPNRYYDDRRHGGHRLPPEELNRGRFQATNNGDGEVGNSGNVPHDSAAVRGTASNDGGVGSIGTSQNLSNE